MTANPDQPHIGLIVEGQGDKHAVPLLLRAYLNTIGRFDDILGKPIPCNGRGAATAPAGIEGYVATAAARPGCKGVLVVLDCESDLSCVLGPQLQNRGESVVAVPVFVALADECFEDWIYASAETLSLGIGYDSQARGILAIKTALSPVKYVKPIWQPRLTARVDLKLAMSRNPSLARMIDKFEILYKLV